MRRATVIVCALMSAGLLIAPGELAAQRPLSREDAREVFLQRVNEYVAIHRRLEAGLPPQVVTSNVEALRAPRLAMARAMRQARTQARQGDVFTPEVAVLFRMTIGETLERHGITNLLALIEEENTVHIPAAVNGEYPAGRAIPPMLPCLLAVLPGLPEEVQYSLVGRDLILWDLHAGIIVDVLPRAVPVLTEPDL